MHPDISSVLLTHQQIAERTAQLGEAVSRDYQGKELTAICVLKGAALFFSQLVQEIKLPVTLDFIQVSSYGKSTVSGGKLAWLKQPEFPVAGKHILLVEDILDTGFTLWNVRQKLLGQGAASVKICTLLDKPARRKVPQIQADYAGYTVPDAFLVGVRTGLRRKVPQSALHRGVEALLYFTGRRKQSGDCRSKNERGSVSL